MKNILLALLLSMFSIAGFGNMAEPQYFQKGDLTSEPFVKRYASITREDLFIDLTALAQNKNGIVRATYFACFEKDVENFELLFLANQLNGRNFKVHINNLRVEGQILDSVPLPSSVNIPPFSPSFEPFETLSFNAHSPKGILFKSSIPAGEHKITVEYEVSPALYGSEFSLTKIWQLAYLLAPARSWKSFNDLNIKICIPEGWKAVTNISLIEKDNCLTGSMKQISDDYLTVSLKAPHQLAVATDTGISVLLVLVILFLSHLLVRTLARKRAYNKIHFILSYLLLIFASLVSTAILTVYIFIEPDLLRYLLNDQLNWNYGISRPYFVFAVPVLWFFLLVGIILYYFIYLGRLKRNMVKIK